MEIIDDSGSAGPRVEDVSLSEEYHEDFGVYEEALGDRYFLYSNVGNAHEEAYYELVLMLEAAAKNRDEDADRILADLVRK